MKTICALLLSTVMVLASCSNNERKKESAAEPKDKVATGVKDEVYDQEFVDMAQHVLNAYLDFDPSCFAERITLGGMMMDQQGEVEDAESTARETSEASRRLLKTCTLLLKERKMKALHDTIISNFNTFIISPNANIELEDTLIETISHLTRNEYPGDSIRFSTDMEEMLEWRLLHISLVEGIRSFSEDEEAPQVSNERIETVLGLMNARNILGKYDESLEVGEDLIQELQANDPKDEAIEMVEEILEETRQRMKKTK